VAASVSACTQHSLKPVELQGSTGVDARFQVVDNRNIDLLVVVDNSGSMGEEQANLAANFGPLIEELDAVRANYRIGVTTTDNGNPWCTGTGPEGGALVHQSCLDRLDQFVSLSGDVDARDVACRDRCAYTSAQLGIGPDSDPWLANDEGRINIPEGIEAADAFACLAPQGVDGCGFESPLEAMYKALLRAGTVGEAQHGFLRDDAHLAIVFVTDEADCSNRPEWASIFDSDDDTFWGPGIGFPNSSICWNAGVRCDSEGCYPQDHDAAGTPLDPEDPRVDTDAVLFPTQRYVDLLDGIRRARAEQHLTVSVFAIAGVEADGEPNYAGGTNPEFVEDFGVAPGCSADIEGTVACASDADCMGVGTESCGTGGTCIETQTAVPPVRLLGLTREFDGRAFTVCSDDYRPSFQKIGEILGDGIPPSCVPGCVDDVDPTTDLLDPNCVISLVYDDTSLRLPECARDGEAYVIDTETESFVIPNETAVACYALLADEMGYTQTTTDDIHPQCVEDGHMLEVKIARRPGAELPSNAELAGTCSQVTYGGCE
jgi:hypothetical protein